MTLFPWGAGGATEDFPTTLAHELFHCVQYATLSPVQMATLGADGAWWIEGSAEAFAAQAIADSRRTADWLDFAEAYADDAIRHPHGQPLGLEGRFPVEYLRVAATGGQRLTFEPFAVIPGKAEYDCGRRENRLSAANLSSRLRSKVE